MTAEQKIRDLHGRFIYHRDFGLAQFENLASLEEFAVWCLANDYICDHEWPGLTAMFRKMPIHLHRLYDCKRYPQLLLGRGRHAVE